jgi:hypothetical protein
VFTSKQQQFSEHGKGFCPTVTASQVEIAGEVPGVHGMARLPKDMMLASDGSPWIIPNFRFLFVVSEFLEYTTSVPMPMRSFSILCLFIIICTNQSKLFGTREINDATSNAKPTN